MVKDKETCRKSRSERFSVILGPMERNPRPRGLYATIPISSSLKFYMKIYIILLDYLIYRKLYIFRNIHVYIYI